MQAGAFGPALHAFNDINQNSKILQWFVHAVGACPNDGAAKEYL